jgi:quercetin dioxygenase-like cupin family protein
MTDMPRIVGRLDAIVAGASARGGAVWRLEPDPRHLDANVIHLPPGDRIDVPEGPGLDVLAIVVAGSGSVDLAGDRIVLDVGAMVWLPRHAGRSIVAGPDGLTYFSVHTRRPPMTIGRPAPGTTAGDAPSAVGATAMPFEAAAGNAATAGAAERDAAEATDDATATGAADRDRTTNGDTDANGDTNAEVAEMAERLARWEQFGGVWRLVDHGTGTATVSLRRCDGGEETERFTVTTPTVLDWLRTNDRQR